MSDPNTNHTKKKSSTLHKWKQKIWKHTLKLSFEVRTTDTDVLKLDRLDLAAPVSVGNINFKQFHIWPRFAPFCQYSPIFLFPNSTQAQHFPMRCWGRETTSHHRPCSANVTPLIESRSKVKSHIGYLLLPLFYLWSATQPRSFHHHLILLLDANICWHQVFLLFFQSCWIQQAILKASPAALGNFVEQFDP